MFLHIFMPFFSNFPLSTSDGCCYSWGLVRVGVGPCWTVGESRERVAGHQGAGETSIISHFITQNWHLKGRNLSTTSLGSNLECCHDNKKRISQQNLHFDRCWCCWWGGDRARPPMFTLLPAAASCHGAALSHWSLQIFGPHLSQCCNDLMKRCNPDTQRLLSPLTRWQQTLKLSSDQPDPSIHFMENLRWRCSRHNAFKCISSSHEATCWEFDLWFLVVGTQPSTLFMTGWMWVGV